MMSQIWTPSQGPLEEEGSAGERGEEQPPETDVQEGSQFELRRREDLSSTPVSPGVTPTTHVSLQSIYDLLVSNRDTRMWSEELIREETDARL